MYCTVLHCTMFYVRNIFLYTYTTCVYYTYVTYFLNILSARSFHCAIVPFMNNVNFCLHATRAVILICLYTIEYSYTHSLVDSRNHILLFLFIVCLHSYLICYRRMVLVIVDHSVFVFPVKKGSMLLHC